MASKIQRWCVSQTVKGSCIINVDDGLGNEGNATIPEGVYWCDPVYGTLATSAAPSLYGQLAYQVDQISSPNIVGSVSSVVTVLTYFKAISYAFTHATGDPVIEADGCTTEALRLWPAMSLGAYAATTGLFEGGGEYISVLYGCWSPQQGEYGSQQEDAENMGGNTRSFSGYSYGFRVGDPLLRRLIRFSALPEIRVYAGAQTTSPQYDYSFESHIWKYLSRGEMVRIYDDYSATHTYLTSAMTKTSTTAVVASVSGISAQTFAWIDGERVYVSSVDGGSLTLTIQRPNPVAHSAYAPVSTDRVATYVLDNDGGMANMGEFAASRRAYNQTRYDLDIPLLRTNF
jgi:hypothetical protein